MGRFEQTGEETEQKTVAFPGILNLDGGGQHGFKVVLISPGF